MGEIDQIKEKHQKGLLETIKFQLAAFVQKNREDFHRFRKREIKAWQKEIDLFTCLKLFILEKKTIDFHSEMQSQIQEINSFVQTEQEKDAKRDVKELRKNWTASRAASWRGHRILEIIFVLTQNKDQFLDLIRPQNITAPKPSESHSL